ncbi:folate-binding protein YgfZ [Chitinibacter bivalviorum]|uniref:Folate-binding protein YgfZ n=1 Tax=Chitinibacter bivalviorum TaxID=2739434 RepID=A0A7H9BMN5_9NEIS|nr:folate-binding protein YgfZ [Chitinibacter bivalviorum]QLG89702.1 folate-binding protein YgfZ [Chitinibacter bivalviorum]
MSWLDSIGASLSDTGAVISFGNPQTELQAYADNAALIPLTQFGLIRFSGEETQAFLQGQLSSDIRALASDAVQYSSYSTPKGRMQASFLVIRRGDDYLLQVASEIQAAIQKRLAMFIMRSKTKACDANPELALIGLAGIHAKSIIEKAFGNIPSEMSVITQDQIQIIGLANARYQILLPQEMAAAVWQQLVALGATPAGASCWWLGEIQAGAPWITAATQEEFVPQMANLELIGGISFTKGCYPGQEIVARTQYLGKLKRRTYRMHVDSTDAKAGDDVFSPEMNGQASGKIMLAAPAPQGGMELLVVAQIASLEHGLHLGDVNGPLLHNLALPYAMN